MCYVAIENKGMILSFYKNIYVFISLERDWIFCRCVRDRRRLLHWPITSSSLDHTTLCYLQRCTSSLSQLNCVPLASYQPCFSDCRLLDTGKWPLQDCLYLMWTSAYIISQYPHISTQPCDCFCLLTQVHPVQRNLWLMARSRVSVQ